MTLSGTFYNDLVEVCSLANWDATNANNLVHLCEFENIVLEWHRVDIGITKPVIGE